MLRVQDQMLEKAAKKLKKLKAKLSSALAEVERLKSVSPNPVRLSALPVRSS